MNKFFGQKLKELRNEKNLTQLQLAKVFKVSKTTICQWETSKQEPDFDNLVAISKYFDVSTDYLLGIED
ncbi:MAG: helix-turn-helix domain-containing protein [Clostridia bacterium]|nr:helix-turn-helix domain-containing protein [Clostridia bacterium]